MPAGEARFSAGVHSRENSYYYILRSAADAGVVQRQPDGLPGQQHARAKRRSTRSTASCWCRCSRARRVCEHLNSSSAIATPTTSCRAASTRTRRWSTGASPKRVRFRGGRQLATRAPNIAEMFQADTQSWYVSGTGDPCGLNTQRGLRRQRGREPELRSRRSSHLLGAHGRAGAAHVLRPGTCSRTATSGRRSSNATGNPLVDPEDADDLDRGLRLERRTRVASAWTGSTSAMDWYEIEITNMISVEPAEGVYQACLSAASNPTANPRHPACLRVNRNPGNGFAAPTTVSYINAAFAKRGRCRHHRGLAHGPRGRQFRRELHGQSICSRRRRRPRQPAPVIDWKGSSGARCRHVAEQRRVRLPNVHDRQLRPQRRGISRCDGGTAERASTRRRPLQPSSTQTRSAGVLRHLRPVRVLRPRREERRFASAWTICSTRTPVWTGGRTAQDVSPSTGSGTTEAGFYDILGRTFYVGVSK